MASCGNENAECDTIPKGWKLGYCLDENGNDQNTCVIKLDPQGNTFSQCLEARKQQQAATACEFRRENAYTTCHAHTKTVASGSGTARHFCHLLSIEIQGKLTTIRGIFKFSFASLI